MFKGVCHLCPDLIYVFLTDNQKVEFKNLLDAIEDFTGEHPVWRVLIFKIIFQIIQLEYFVLWLLNK